MKFLKISFTVASKRIKHSGIKLKKEIQNLYSENYKPLLKEIKDLSKWTDIHVHGSGELNC